MNEAIKLEENAEISRPIHYLGSKLRILKQIEDVLQITNLNDNAVCDLFAGSGTVSRYLGLNRPVISCDIQEYSKVICEAVLYPINGELDVTGFVYQCRNSEHTKEIFAVFKKLLDYEKNCFYNADSGQIDELYELIDEGSLITYEIQGDNKISNRLKEIFNEIVECLEQKDWVKNPQAMITRYYGGLYFSYYQATCIDAILEQVFNLPQAQRSVGLAAVLSTVSEVVNTIGKQFAQPLKVRDKKGEYKKSLCNKILSDRSIDIFAVYERWLRSYLTLEKSNYDHSVLKMDYGKALDQLNSYNVSAIYADPPYTRYHYSRYYHVLESICLRDNPEVTTTFANGTGGISRGIYRKDRHQSMFGIKSKAECAFDTLFEKSRILNVPLILSYSPFEPSQAVTPRLQTIEQLIEKASGYFGEVRIISPGSFTHSKLNRTDRNFDSNHEAELLIICR